MKPTLSNLHVDTMLTQVSVGYQNAEFIIDEILKRVPVEKQSDKYYVFEGQFDVVDDRVRPGSPAKAIEWDFSRDTFYCDGHAIREYVYDRQRENADSEIDLDMQAAENVQEQILRNREKAGADLLFNANTYETGLKTTLEGTNQWSHKDSDPVSAIEAAREAVALKIGLEPNTLVLGRQVFAKLRSHPGLMAMWNDNARRLLTVEKLQELLDVPKILVGRAMYNTAKQGKTVNKGYIWGKHAALLYVPDRPAQKVPAFGYTFVWKGKNGSQDGIVTYKYRDENIHADVVENEFYYDHKITVGSAGYLFTNAVA